MSYASMYLCLDPLRVKVGKGDLHGYMYKLIILITITASAGISPRRRNPEEAL